MPISSSDCKRFLDRHDGLADHAGAWKRLSKTQDADGVARVFSRDDGSWWARVVETDAGLVLTHHGADRASVTVDERRDTVCLVKGKAEDREAAQALLDEGLNETEACVRQAAALGAAFTNRLVFAVVGSALDVEPMGDFAVDDDNELFWMAVFVPDELWLTEKLWYDRGLPLAGLLEEGSYSPNETSEWFVCLKASTTLHEATRALLDLGFVWSESLMQAAAQQMETRVPKGFAAWVKQGADLRRSPNAGKAPAP